MPDPDKQESATGDTQAEAQENGVSASSRPKRPARRRKSRPRRLIDTHGPAPNEAIEDVRLTIGRLGAPHGIDGEMRMILLTDAPEHLLTLDHVYLGSSTEPAKLEGIRFHADVALVSLKGVDTPEAARRLGGLDVRIDGANAQPLEDGEYFLYQLIGLKAVTPDGDALGVVADLMETAAHDVLVIATGTRGDLLVPNHPVYVHEINPDKGLIVVTPPVYADEQ